MGTITIPKMTVYAGTIALIVLLLAVFLSFSQDDSDPTRTPIDIVVHDKPLAISQELQLILANRKIRGVNFVTDNSELLAFMVSPKGDSLDPIALCDPALKASGSGGDKISCSELDLPTLISVLSGTCYLCFSGGNFKCHKKGPDKRRYSCPGPTKGVCSCPVPP